MLELLRRFYLWYRPWRREFWGYWAIAWFGIVVTLTWLLLALFGWHPAGYCDWVSWK